jgi:hypothetical protein
MQDYPNASQSSFFQLLRERCGTPNPPSFLNEITLSPPLLRARHYHEGLIVTFLGPKPESLPYFPEQYSVPLTSKDVEFGQTVGLPHLRLFCGDFSTKPACVTHRFSYNLKYKNLDFELFDWEVVDRWIKEDYIAGDKVRRLHFPR